MSAERNEHAAALGRLGGRKGGLARAAKLSPKERQDIARLAALARWHSDTPLELLPPQPPETEESILAQITMLENTLRRLDAERDLLAAMLESYQALLKLRAQSG